MNSRVDSQQSEGGWEYIPDPLLHEGLVEKIVRSYQGRSGSLDEDDLRQAGRIGLILACRKYDRSHNVKVSAYAKYWISRMIRDEILSCGYSVRIPRNSFKCRTRAGSRAGMASDDMLRRDFLGGDATSPIVDDCDRFEDRVELADELERLGRAMSLLGSASRRMISERFGLDGEPPKSLRCIVRDTGIHYKKVYGLYHNAMEELRAILNEGGEL